ncbi:hypothetical protein [uncultured Dialister sp.]|uniref:hypothetical protein n=1 Tax=uncultured Dialister sp. TaxID=278064 RepID=UPI002671D081|nr:hypothetical protein [uncultured Dialister sp.]
MADSSFSYSSLFKRKTLMVIIPHEDDEINIAGSTIHGSILEGRVCQESCVTSNL